IVPNDAVAGDSDGEIVRSARAGNRAYAPGGSDTPSNFRIRSRLADWDLLKRMPYALLEGGAANIERKIKADPRRLNEADNPSHQGLIGTIGTNEMGLRKAVLKVAHKVVRVVSQQDRGDAPFARCDQDGAEGCLSDGELDLLVGTAGAILRRSHSEYIC